MSNLTYTRHGDYLLPNIVLQETPYSSEPLTKYGFMRRSFLKNHRPIEYNKLLLSEQLHPHLCETQRTANERMERMMAQLIECNPPPDKAADGLAWAAHMTMLHDTAEELVVHELIYE